MMKNSLKFANIARLGDRIRAYDFKPMADHPDRYVEGVVIAVGRVPEGFDAFTIEVDVDTAWPENPRDLVFVPHEVSFLEWDGRVMKLESPARYSTDDTQLERNAGRI